MTRFEAIKMMTQEEMQEYLCGSNVQNLRTIADAAEWLAGDYEWEPPIAYWEK